MYVDMHLDTLGEKNFCRFSLTEQKNLEEGHFYRVLGIETGWRQRDVLNIYLTTEQARELAETIQQALEEKAEGVA